MLNEELDFTVREARKQFIKNNESSIYTGKNVDGEDVIVCLNQNEGMTVKTSHKNKPRWLECIEYDEEGYRISVSYEPN